MEVKQGVTSLYGKHTADGTKPYSSRSQNQALVKEHNTVCPP